MNSTAVAPGFAGYAAIFLVSQVPLRIAADPLVDHSGHGGSQGGCFFGQFPSEVGPSACVNDVVWLFRHAMRFFHCRLVEAGPGEAAAPVAEGSRHLPCALERLALRPPGQGCTEFVLPVMAARAQRHVKRPPGIRSRDLFEGGRQRRGRGSVGRHDLANQVTEAGIKRAGGEDEGLSEKFYLAAAGLATACSARETAWVPSALRDIRRDEPAWCRVQRDTPW
jgi:hypothetical protein